jgi:hypothetical protein
VKATAVKQFAIKKMQIITLLGYAHEIWKHRWGKSGESGLWGLERFFLTNITGPSDTTY